MAKEEKLKIITEVNDRFNEVEDYLIQLEAIENLETNEKNSEVDYSQAVTSARGTLAILIDYFNWYKATVDERD